MSYSQIFQSLREKPETERVGKKWTDEENTKLMEEAMNGVSFDEIAKTHQRTRGGIRSHLMTLALKEMEADEELTFETISKRIHISVAELKAYKERKEINASLKQQTNSEKKPMSDIHSDKKWTDEENTLMVKRLTDGMRLDVIAKAHQRTLEDIQRRIVKNGLEPPILPHSTHPESSKTTNGSHKNTSDITDLLIEIRDLLKQLVNK